MGTSETDIDTKKRHNRLFYLMGSFLSLLFLGICFFLVGKNSVFVASKTIIKGGTVFINGTVSVAETDHDFVCATLDWWPPDKCDYNTCSWGRASLLNLDLTNPILLNAVKAFSPLKIRLGGTLQDKVIYERQGENCPSFSKNSSEMFGFSQGCLPMSRWDELNTFFKKSGAAVIFGLNALEGRTIIPGGSAVGAWDPNDAENLIRYTVNKGHKIHGWELGNELSGNGVGTRVAAAQYASDLNTLQEIVHRIYSGFGEKPLILGPGGFLDENWFTQFIDKASESLQVVTQHIYNLGPGVDNHLVDKILDPSYLDEGSQVFSGLETILKSSGTRAVAWVGEAGGAYNSGRNLVTNAFVFSFWYLDQLGMSSIYNTKTYCRQTLIGGNYGLLNTDTFEPNPDYYSALLWHRLMGKTVLSTNFSGTKKLRVYAHCSKASQGFTLLLINLDGNTTIQVHVSTSDADKNLTWTGQENMSGRANFAKISRGSAIKSVIYGSSREEYHLTAKDGDLHSQTVLLNGKVLAVDSSGAIPSLEPVRASFNDPITIAPFSIVFAQIVNWTVPACAQSQ